MKSIKKKVNKILLSLTMVFTMALTIMPTNVQANNVYDIHLLEDGTLEYKNQAVPLGEKVNIAPENLRVLIKNSNYEDLMPYMNGKMMFGSIKSGKDQHINPTAFCGGNTGNVSIIYNGDYKLYFTVTYDIKVNSGITEKAEYSANDTITITANTPAVGKHFKEWAVVSGDVTLNDSTSETTTFTMPNKAVEITAIYEDTPHTHTPATAWSKDETNHWHECSANDGEKMNLSSHAFGDWVIDTPATESTKGSKHRECNVCKQIETLEIPVLSVTPKIEPVIKETAKQSSDNNSTLVFSAFLLLSVCVINLGTKKKELKK